MQNDKTNFSPTGSDHRALAALGSPAERSSRQVVAALSRGAMPDAIVTGFAAQGLTLRWPTIREYAGLTEAHRSVSASNPVASTAAPRPKPVSTTAFAPSAQASIPGSTTTTDSADGAG